MEPWSGKSVLVVDDSDMIRACLKHLYEEVGIVVVGEAANGEEAIEMAEEISPELISLDLKMPVMCGEEAYSILKKSPGLSFIIVSGIDAAGRGDVVNALNEWLDTRGLETIALDSLTDEEHERPYYWRFWRQLPARGRIGIFFGGWYVGNRNMKVDGTNCFEARSVYFCA